LKITSNALVRAEQDCFKELFEAVDITRRISEYPFQSIPFFSPCVLMPHRYPPSVSDLKVTCLPNHFSDYSLDWTSPNLSLVDLAVVCIGHFKNPGLID